TRSTTLLRGTEGTRQSLRRCVLRRRAHDWGLLPACLHGARAEARQLPVFLECGSGRARRLSAVFAVPPGDRARHCANRCARRCGARCGALARCAHGIGRAERTRWRAPCGRIRLEFTPAATRVAERIRRDADRTGADAAAAARETIADRDDAAVVARCVRER